MPLVFVVKSMSEGSRPGDLWSDDDMESYSQFSDFPAYLSAYGDKPRSDVGEGERSAVCPPDHIHLERNLVQAPGCVSGSRCGAVAALHRDDYPLP